MTNLLKCQTIPIVLGIAVVFLPLHLEAATTLWHIIIGFGYEYVLYSKCSRAARAEAVFEAQLTPSQSIALGEGEIKARWEPYPEASTNPCAASRTPGPC